jgi:predicted  nucleic acid-binding Zn-ribbon protein
MATDPKPHAALVSGGWEEFLLLEAKISRVTELLGQARESRHRAEQEASDWRAKYLELKQEFTRSERELVALRKEREEVRRRVERLVEQLDALGE